MEKSKILFKDSIIFLKGNFWKLFGLFVLLIAFQIFIGSILELLDALESSAQIIAIRTLILIISYGINFWVVSVIYTFVYQKLNNVETQFPVLFHFDKRKIWNLYIVAILSGLIICAGFLLLIVPGIILMIMSSFALLLVILKNIKPIDAIIHSFNMIWGRTWIFIGKSMYPVLYFLVLFLIMAIGVIISIFVAMFSEIFSLALFVILGLVFLFSIFVLVLSMYVYYIKLYIEFDRTAPILEQTRHDILQKRFTILAFIGLILPMGLALLLINLQTIL